jgi:hypothetical protein
MHMLVIMVSEVQGNLASYAHFGGYSKLPSADAFESSTAMGDNAMFPETTFNP